METSSSPKDLQPAGIRSRLTNALLYLPHKLSSFAIAVKNLGQDDPRRIFHAIKVGLAICFVSLFYYLHPIYDGLGDSTMWAVLTVIVVFEFSVGATLGKGVNRMVATGLAGALGVGAHHLADIAGKTGEPIVLLIFGFVVAVVMTFMRFFPKIKARYDYGFMIFILTFSLVAVSGYRDDEVLSIAWKRLSTVIIGCCIAVMVSVLICPVWSGEELHKLIASNIDKLGSFLEGCGDETKLKVDSDKSFLTMYKNVLVTKTQEDTMANLARWEPAHGKFRFRHPWKQYLKVGVLTRQCAYKIDAVNVYLNSESHVAAAPSETQDQFKELCMRLSYESGKALKELSRSMKKMKTSPLVKTHIKESKCAAAELKSLLESTRFSGSINLLELLPMATAASLLIEIATSIEQVAVSVQELAKMAGFKAAEAAVSPEKVKEGAEHVVIVIDDQQDEPEESIKRSKVVEK